MARVSVTVTVRDLTRAELTRMRHNFNSLGQDLTNAVGNRSRQNFERLSQSINVARRDLTRLRGIIPESEFIRLDNAIRQSQRTMQRGFSNVGDRAFRRVADRVQEVVDGFADLDRLGQIRLRVDTSALDRADALLERWRRDNTRRTSQSFEQGAQNVNGNRITRYLTRSLTSPFRLLRGLISGTLSDGVGQGILGAMQAAGPIVAAIFVASLVAALSLVGAALAGALIFALGAAFVGLGGFIAAQSKQVTTAWEKEINRLKPLFKEAAEPMIPVLVKAIGLMGEMGREFAPKLKEALEQAAPQIDGFLARTKAGFKRMGENAWQDLQQAFRVFTDAFGPQWEDFLAEFGSSLGALARTVTEHSEEMAMALRVVLGVINLLIDTINFFANAWVLSIKIAQAGIAGFLTFLAFFTEQVLNFMGMMLDAMVKAFGEIPGLGPKLKEAQKNFGQFKDTTVEKFNELAARANQWGAEMDAANKERILRVNIDSWNNQLNRAKDELKSVPPEKKTELLGRINDLQAKINQANGQLARMQKDYYVRIHAYKVGDWATGGGGPYAHGGVVGRHMGRAATGGARSNMTIVGEHGPELVNLPPGSHVRSNPDSRRMLSEGGGGGGGSTLILKSSGRRVDDLLIEVLRESIHQRGGDPVTVLGGR